MTRRPGARAAGIVLLSILGGALANLATSAFDLTVWRWWLVGGVIAVGAVWAAIEYARAQADEPVPEPPEAPVESGVPWMVPQLPRDTVPRPELIGETVRLLASAADTTVGVTTALHGAGGFGKTTLAAQVCAEPAIRQRFPGGLLWATIGQDRTGPALAAIINDLCEQLTGERPGLTDPEQAGHRLGRLTDTRGLLLVVDDVWTADQLRPFLAGRSTSRLVTTRIPGLLPDDAEPVRVDEMPADQSRTLLTRDLPALEGARVDALLRLTGRWPLLLALLNGTLRRAAREGADPAATADRLISRLTAGGPGALDVAVERRRTRAVRDTVESSLETLSPGDRERYLTLGIFAEDTDIPLDVIAHAWRTAPAEVERLVEELAELSLFAEYRRDRGTIRLHDVLRSYLRHELGDDLPRANSRFLAAAGAEAEEWWLLPDDADYLWRHVAYHLAETGDQHRLKTLVCDLRWISAKLRRYDVAAAEEDVARCTAPIAKELSQFLAREGHLLTRTDPPHAVGDILAARVGGVPALAHLAEAFLLVPPPDGWRVTARWPVPDAVSGQLRALTGHTGAVAACAISPDGSWLASGSADDTVRIWEARTGRTLHTLSAGRDVEACAFSPDGSWLVAGADDGTVTVWDTATGERRYAVKDPTGVDACAVAPDGAWFVTTGDNGTARLWNAADGTIRLELSTRFGRMWGCGVSPDGTWLVTTDDGGAAIIWEATTGRQRRILTGHTGDVWTCAIAPDGTWLVTAGADGTARIWDVADGRVRHVLAGHTDAVHGAAVAPDGSWLVTTARDKTVRIWDAGTGRELATLLGHTGLVMNCAIAPDGSWMATGGTDGTVRLWSTATDDAVASSDLSRSEHGGWFERCTVSPDGTWLAAIGTDEWARVWDLRNGRRTATVALKGELSGCAAAPDGAWLAVSSRGGDLFLRDTATEEVRTFADYHRESTASCAVSPDGTGIVTGDVMGTARIRDFATGRIRTIFQGPQGSMIDRCVYSPDGSRLITASRDGRARIWDLTTRDPLVLDGHSSWLTGCAVSGDGDWVVTVGLDRTVRIWDLATGAHRRTLTGHTAPVYSCAISPDGTWLATGDREGAIRIWAMPAGEPIAAMRLDGEAKDMAAVPDGTGLCVVGPGGLYLFDVVPPTSSR